nr:uncharacterized protein LOC106682051 [Halyomorpha halys]
MSRDSILEIQHKREQSHDSGTYQDWTLEESFQHTPGQQCKNSDFVTVVAVDEKPFVTVLSVENGTSDSEDVLVYRLPGERLGFGLKFDGGIKNAEKVKKLLIQSCADDSPASRTRASWGPLAPGDEILVIDSVPVSEMTRMDCVRALKESNVVIKLRVRRGQGKEEDKEAPPIPPRKFPRKKENVEPPPPPPYVPPQPMEEQQKNSPPVLPRSRQLPQAELYTDLIAQESILPTESESDDTGSSISTVVSRISSTPTTCNSSFSDGRSIDLAPPPVPGAKPTAYDLDKVLEPFLRLEREFSSSAINEANLFHSLAEASNLKSPSPLEEEESAPKPAPRQERRRPPPPPPPRTDRHEQRHLPRLIDFVPKDRTDLVVPSPLVPSQLPTQPKPVEEPVKEEMTRNHTKELPDGTAETKSSNMEPEEYIQKPESSFHKEKYPPSCSRLPPDGHEYPSLDKKSVKPSNEPKSTMNLSTPPILPKSTTDVKKSSNETSKYASWRNDEKSEKSVKDKIAMFSNVQQNKDISNTPPVKYCKKQNWQKSLETETNCNVLNDCQQKQKNDLPATKLLVKKDSLTFQSLLDVTNNYDNYKETIPKNDRTQSTFDLTDNAFNNHSAATKTEFSTLPRKNDTPRNKLCESKSSTSNTSSLSRALSFSGETKLHSRSQSLVDVGSKYNSTFLKNEEARRCSLAALSEQRKKGMSKLRGLVIPEKVIEVPTLVVDDLPIIKSSDCPITNNLEENIISKVDNDKISNSKLPNDKNPALITSSPWKTELTSHNYEIPKYSPAFKRKSLSLYGTSSCVSSVSSSLSSSREELRNCFYDTSKTLSGANTSISRSLASLSRNPYLNVQSSHSEPKSLESITSPSISDLSNDYGQDSVSPNLNNETLPQYKYNEGYASDSQQSKNEERGLEEESDNDSAVSSSRSSISPPHSPSPCLKKNDEVISPKTLNRYEVKLKRSLSSETTASNASSGSTLTSGSQASSSSTGGCLSLDNKRVLKPQSVEAINRKNVLSSAKFSSGTDLKHETPSDEQNDIKDQLPLMASGSITENQEKIEAEKQMNSEPNMNELNDNFEFNMVPVNGKSSIEFSNFHSPVDNDQIKNHTHNTELIKCETSFNIEDFTYSSHKNIDKNSNMKINNFNDFPDGIIPNENTNKWNENSSGVEYVPIMKVSRPILQIDPNQYDKQKDERENIPSPQGISVNNMKKVFEKVESILVPNTRFKVNNQNLIQHPRIPSVDSTNSDDSCIPNLPHYGSASNLQKEQQFGSITSLASSTSLISQQELSQLIEEANHTLEDEGNTQEVLVVILYRDMPGGSIGITLAGGADYEAKEITVHKVLIGSPAERDGRIQKGDRILSINGKSMKGLTHYESLAILKAPRPEVVLVVSRNKGDVIEESCTPKYTSTAVRTRFSEQKLINTSKAKDTKWGPPVVVTLIKDGTGLGFSLEGGKDSPYGDLPLTIKKIFTGGCAEKCGNLFAGDELLSVNNIDLCQLSRIEAWALMKRLPDGEVNLNVRHQYS